ncbi:MAG TPA: hypothetical protein VGS19_10835 [Streptosporangiaceae bacterium]|nr:hypothetical protein [Streptosporangiaceae bacterium]
MFISEQRELGADGDAARVRLARLVQADWLPTASREAYQDGIGQFVRVGPFGDTPGMSRLVRVCYVEPLHKDGVMTVGVRWEATGITGPLFPVLDADIRLSGQNPGSLVALTGCYRPPFGTLGSGLDRVLLHAVATATISKFLAILAEALEDSSPAAQEAAMPPRWVPRLEPADWVTSP